MTIHTNIDNHPSALTIELSPSGNLRMKIEEIVSYFNLEQAKYILKDLQKQVEVMENKTQPSVELEHD